MTRATRLSGCLLLALLSAVSARAVPVSPVGTPAAADAVAAPQLVDTGLHAVQPGLPAFASGQLLPRVAGEQPGVRSPLRGPRAALSPTYPVAVETSRARIRLAVQCGHAQALADLRRNLPTTYGNPPPASLS